MPNESSRSKRALTHGSLFFIVPILAAALLYAFGDTSKRGAEACRAAFDVVQKMKPFARGEVAGVQVLDLPTLVEKLAFLGPGGEKLSLEAFSGRVVLLNLWATWCVPCRKEMPTLDALQAAMGNSHFQVVAVNIDTRNLDKPRAFLEETGVNNLVYYADPSAKIFQDLKASGRAFGMPATLILDSQGCELARLAGPAEWGSEDAMKLVGAALGK